MGGTSQKQLEILVKYTKLFNSIPEFKNSDRNTHLPLPTALPLPDPLCHQGKSKKLKAS